MSTIDHEEIIKNTTINGLDYNREAEVDFDYDKIEISFAEEIIKNKRRLDFDTETNSIWFFKFLDTNTYVTQLLNESSSLVYPLPLDQEKEEEFVNIEESLVGPATMLVAKITDRMLVKLNFRADIPATELLTKDHIPSNLEDLFDGVKLGNLVSILKILQQKQAEFLIGKYSESLKQPMDEIFVDLIESELQPEPDLES